MRQQTEIKKRQKNTPKRLVLDSSKILIPTGIFSDRTLSFFESLVKFLKEELKLKYSEIGQLTNRDERNIWTLYHRSLKKKGGAPLSIKPDSLGIPLSVLADRSLSILEVMVYYLRHELGIPNQKIAELLDRSPKTISTCYQRSLRKKQALSDDLNTREVRDSSG